MRYVKIQSLFAKPTSNTKIYNMKTRKTQKCVLMPKRILQLACKYPFDSYPPFTNVPSLCMTALYESRLV